MNLTFWQIVCAVLVSADIIASAWVMRERAIWNKGSTALAILGFGAEGLVLFYVLGVIH